VRVHPEDVAEDEDAVVGAPDQAAREKGTNEAESIDELVDGARQVQFVAEPVDVQERAGELEEDKDGCVVVDEGSLCFSRVSNVVTVGGCLAGECYKA
jgi:hypothetical protein